MVLPKREILRKEENKIQQNVGVMFVGKISKLIGFNLIKAGNGLMKTVLT